MPMTEAELREHVDLGNYEGAASLHYLMATGLVTANGNDRGTFYSLDRAGFSRITSWLAPFDLCTGIWYTQAEKPCVFVFL